MTIRINVTKPAMPTVVFVCCVVMNPLDSLKACCRRHTVTAELTAAGEIRSTISRWNRAIGSISLESGTCLPVHNLQEKKKKYTGLRPAPRDDARTQSAIKSCVAWAAIMYEIKLPSLTCQVGRRRHYPPVPSLSAPRQGRWMTNRKRCSMLISPWSSNTAPPPKIS